MTQPGTPGSQIPDSGVDDTLLRPMRDLERRIKALEATAQGTNGIVVANNSTIKSSPFDGDLVGQAAGTVGWGMDGDTAIFNNLVLRGGIIGNDALTSPADFGANGQSGVAFGINAGATVVATQTITIPAGYSRAIVMAVGNISAWEVNGNLDTLIFYCDINGTGSSAQFADARPNSPAHCSNTSVRYLTGLSGGSITFQGIASVGVAWGAHGGNICNINAIAMFLR